MTVHIETNDIYTVSAGSSDGGKRHFSFPTRVPTINEWPQLNIPETKELKKIDEELKKTKTKSQFLKAFFLREFSLRPHFWMVKQSPVLLQAFFCALYSHRSTENHCSSHGKLLTFILFQRGTNSHKRHFLWPKQLWKLWRWNSSFGLLKCHFPLAHRLWVRLWVVCPLHLCPAACSPGHSLAGICRITAN